MNNEIASRFQVKGSVVSCERYGSGHINETYLVQTDAGEKYILQKINSEIFRDVPALMRNIAAVTGWIAKKDPDSRHTMHLVPAADGENVIHDAEGGWWRMYDFVRDSLCLQAAQTEEDFYLSAVAFGDFQRQLADFPAETLSETIARFHDTRDRYRQLHEAMEKDSCGRLVSVRAEVDFALAREAEAGAMMALLEKGELPLRVTHNDTKLNNVLFDAETRRPICVIDLDTVMPGLAAFDYGDSIRFGASTAAEDETDLSRVEMSLKLFEAYTRGFMEACGANLTETERRTLPMGAKLMTLECGVRFLTDYLSGDVYFRIHRPEHNLDRCRTQFKLVADMEKKWDEMARIVSEQEKKIL